MKRTATIAAVGDILMWQPQIDAARLGGRDKYRFDDVFRPVAPTLRQADLTIGNLETTLSGRERRYQRRNPRTGWPMFNCPDELAPALKRAGFDVLTTANNHCMDRGVNGLKRTIRVLDRYGIAHTGTFCSKASARSPLMKNVNGIRLGILAYTYGTNRIPVPKGQSWRVNRIRTAAIIRDIRTARARGADLVIVCLHFGREFRRRPAPSQEKLVTTLFRHGADVILGAHPHVLQPMATQTVKRTDGSVAKGFVIYSLGNFVSDQMRGIPDTRLGVILRLAVAKDERGTRITGVRAIPTWVERRRSKGTASFRVVPARANGSSGKLARVWRRAMRRLSG